ncbi:MAG: hypothetical protein IKW39_03950, partial [Alphaproteobacteria bacterium]|nr:hypothetical protein [Alphaproteobacteria bacterium]
YSEKIKETVENEIVEIQKLIDSFDNGRVAKEGIKTEQSQPAGITDNELKGEFISAEEVLKVDAKLSSALNSLNEAIKSIALNLKSL